MAVIRTKTIRQVSQRLIPKYYFRNFELKSFERRDRKSNFVIERDPKSLITKSLVKEGKTPDFEAKVLNEKNQFSKVRITYNQDYLPIKLEWYFKGKDGLKWYTWSRFSYPYKTESEFNKNQMKKSSVLKILKRSTSWRRKTDNN